MENTEVKKTIREYKNSIKNFYVQERKRIWNSRYIPTLIPGLDKLLRGGLILPHNTNSKDIENIVILIKGQAGTGKTTLATQIMLGVYYYLVNTPTAECMDIDKLCLKDDQDFTDWKSSVNARRSKFLAIKDAKLYPIVYSCEQTGEEFQTYLKRFLSCLHDFVGQDKKANSIEKYAVPNPKLIVARTLKVRKAELYEEKPEGIIGEEYQTSQKRFLSCLHDFVGQDKKANSNEKYAVPNPKLIVARTLKVRKAELYEEKPEGIIVVKKDNESIRRILKSVLESLQKTITLSTNDTKELHNHWLENVLEKNVKMSGLKCLKEISSGDLITKLIEILDDTAYTDTKHEEHEKYMKAIEGIDSSVDIYLNDYFGYIVPREDETKPGLSVAEGTRSFSAWKDDLESFLFCELTGKNPHPVVLVDGLNSFSERSRRTLDTQKIIRKLRERAVFSIIVYEDDKQHYENLDYLADIVIQLKGEVVNRTPNYYINNLMIEKSRFQQSVLGWHQYKIRSNGFEVFPSLNFRTHRLDKLTEFYKTSQLSLERLSGENKNNNDCSSSSQIHRTACFTCDNFQDQKHIDKQLGVHLPEKPVSGTQIDDSTLYNNFLEFILQSKIKYGSSIAVLGPRHTFKLQSTLDFLRTGSRINEAGLIVSLLDSDRSLEKDRKSLCKWLCKRQHGDILRDTCAACYNHVYVLHLRPGCVTPEEFMSLLERRLIDGAKAGEPIRRLLFWDLVHLESRFPFFVDDPLFLPALIDYLRYHWAITVVFVGPSNSKMANHVASLVSNLIFTWRDSLAKEQALNLSTNDFYSFYSSAIESSPSQSNFTFFLRGGFEGIGDTGSPHYLQESIQTLHEGKLTIGDNSININDLSQHPDWFENATNMRRRIWELQGLRSAIDVEGIFKPKQGE